MVKVIKVTEAKSVLLTYRGEEYWLRQVCMVDDLTNLLRTAEERGREEIRDSIAETLCVLRHKP